MSGTSRQATPSLSRVGRRDLDTGPPTEPPRTQVVQELMNAHRSSTHSSESSLSATFLKPQALLTPAEYSLPYKQRTQQDLSGTQQQLSIHNLSTHSPVLSDLNAVPHQLKQSWGTNALPKSKTLGSLLSPLRETTPGRRLLQPIGPSLPRTQTLANLSCFSPPSQTPSPRKTKSISLSPPSLVDNDSSQVSIADALDESRMSEKEMDLLIQVQREAAANRARLRGDHQRFSLRQHKGLTTLASGGAPSLKLSLNDVANTQRLEGMKRRSSSGRLLFINSTLANQNWQRNDPPTSKTIVSIGSVTSSDTSCNEENDPRNVYTAEPTAYWTGRYVSLCDRIRTRELNQPPPSPATTSEAQIDQLFESREKFRMRSALVELRDRCKTDEALKSFEEFEGALLKQLGVSRQSLHRISANASGKEVGKALRPSRTMPLSLRPSQSPAFPSATNGPSSINAEAITSASQRSLYGEISLAKSKTTGNLASLVPTIPKRQHFLVTRPQPGTKSTPEQSHRRKTSYFESSRGSREEVMRDREQRAARQTADSHRREGSQGLPSDGSNSQRISSGTSSTVQLIQSPADIHQSVEKDNHQIDRPVSPAMLESGHGLPPAPPPTQIARSRVELVRMSSGGTEKVIKSRRKPERQFSGDRMKNLLGAGVREVKKMGRRVSGMSWPGSEEL